MNYFSWERLIGEVKPGDEVTLTVVRPLGWRLLGSVDAPGMGPVAGVRTKSTIYLDPAIPAATWTAQATFVRGAILLLAMLLVFAVLYFVPGSIPVYFAYPMVTLISGSKQPVSWGDRSAI